MLQLETGTLKETVKKLSAQGNIIKDIRPGKLYSDLAIRTIKDYSWIVYYEAAQNKKN